MPFKPCGVVYDGPSCPEFHGVPCARSAGHDAGSPFEHGAKHEGYCGDGTPLRWFTAEQKRRRAELRKAAEP